MIVNYLSNVSGKSVHVVSDVSVGAVIQKSLGSLVTTFSARQEQRSLVLAVLGISVSSIGQENVDSINIVDTGGPVQSRLASLITRVDVSLLLDQLLHHPLNGESGGQDERRGPVEGPGVQVGCSVSHQDLENSLSISCNRGVKRSATSVVDSIGVRFSVEKFLGGVSSGVPGSQVQRSLPGLVHGVVDAGALSNQVLDHVAGVRIFFIVEITLIKTSSSE